MRWINELVHRHGRDNWCLYVDADEALVFADCERIGLRGLADYLSAKGHEAVSATMLDMYPDAIASLGGLLDQMAVIARCGFFDNRFISQGYPMCPYNEILGGVRRRLLAGYTLMNKTPLIRGGSGIRFLLSSHRVTPARTSDVTAALLHYHLGYLFADDFRHLVQEEVDRRQHPSNAVERRRYLKALPEVAGRQSLLSQDSVRFESSRQLLELGVLRAS